MTPRVDLLQGTLDMLILKVLSVRPAHGYAVVRTIQQTTDGVLQVEEGSLYPALHRMEQKGWIKSSWGRSENNRRAKYYELTRKGERQLAVDVSIWKDFSEAASRILALGYEAK